MNGQQLSLPTRSRADEIRDAFLAFHKQNPKVWHLFKRFTFELIDAGHKHYSARAVIHRIRWHTDVETVDPDAFPEGLKINDHYSPWYARAFQKVYPDHEGFFRNRKLTSANDLPKDW
jgi:hypothetical protein